MTLGREAEADKDAGSAKITEIMKPGSFPSAYSAFLAVEPAK